MIHVADHKLDHNPGMIGVDHIGIGGDYDGISLLPAGLEDVTTYPDLFADYSDGVTARKISEKIAGRNLLRVMREAEQTAHRLQQERGPSQMNIR